MRERSAPRAPRAGQEGLSLIELLVVLALSTIVGAAAVMAIHQTMTRPAMANNQNIAINQVRNAGYWMSRDAQMAATVSVNPDVDFLEVTWQNWDGSETHTSTYTLPDSAGGLQELWRTCDGQPIMVAQYIDPDPYNTNCTWNETAGVLTITITARAGDKVETRTFEVNPRPMD